MNKTPDEIKKGLECCMNDSFLCKEECPYFNSLSNGVDCAVKKNADALAYIQQLETERHQLLTKCERLEEKCRQLERERDAAVKDISMGSRCTACRKFFKNGGDCSGGGYCLPLRFEWRGVKEDYDE